MGTIIKLACVLLTVWFCTGIVGSAVPMLGSVVFHLLGVAVTGLFLFGVGLFAFIGKIVLA